MDGFSMSALLAGETLHAREPQIPLGVEVSGHSALYRGDYKLVRTPPPLGDSSWRLYNITADPGETTNLAAQMPELVTAMLADYEAYAERVGVLDLPPGYDPQRQVVQNTRMKTFQHYWYISLRRARVAGRLELVGNAAVQTTDVDGHSRDDA